MRGEIKTLLVNHLMCWTSVVATDCTRGGLGLSGWRVQYNISIVKAYSCKQYLLHVTIRNVHKERDCMWTLPSSSTELRLSAFSNWSWIFGSYEIPWPKKRWEHTIYYLRSDVGVTVVIFRIFLPQCTIVTMQCFLFRIQYVGISAKAPHFLRLI